MQENGTRIKLGFPKRVGCKITKWAEAMVGWCTTRFAMSLMGGFKTIGF